MIYVVEVLIWFWESEIVFVVRFDLNGIEKLGLKVGLNGFILFSIGMVIVGIFLIFFFIFLMILLVVFLIFFLILVNLFLILFYVFLKNCCFLILLGGIVGWLMVKLKVCVVFFYVVCLIFKIVVFFLLL